MATEASQTTNGQRPEVARPYVDGFVIAVPRDRIDEYERIARDAAAVWREHGALRVVECVADDVLTSFPRAVQASDDETVSPRRGATFHRPSLNGMARRVGVRVQVYPAIDECRR